MAYVQHPLRALSHFVSQIGAEQEAERLRALQNQRLERENQRWANQMKWEQRREDAFQRELAEQKRIGPVQEHDFQIRLQGEKPNTFYNTRMDPENPSLPPYANITQENIAASPQEILEAGRRINKAHGLAMPSAASLMPKVEGPSDEVVANAIDLIRAHKRGDNVSTIQLARAYKIAHGAGLGKGLPSMYSSHGSEPEMDPTTMAKLSRILNLRGQPGSVTEWKTGPNAWVGEEMGGLPEAAGEDAFTTRPSTKEEQLIAARAIKGSELTYNEKMQILSGPKPTETVENQAWYDSKHGVNLSRSQINQITDVLFDTSTETPSILANALYDAAEVLDIDDMGVSEGEDINFKRGEFPFMTPSMKDDIMQNIFEASNLVSQELLNTHGVNMPSNRLFTEMVKSIGFDNLMQKDGKVIDNPLGDKNIKLDVFEIEPDTFNTGDAAWYWDTDMKLLKAPRVRTSAEIAKEFIDIYLRQKHNTAALG